ncbi:hypothetical protein N9I61_00805 [Flavobacteriales bacterium]|nr:hypothetical protein [Flavobacteriales bacterium]
MKLNHLFSFFFLLVIGANALGQNQPLSLSTEVSTTRYTDGSSASKARMFFQVAGGPAQNMGFIGGKLKPHLNGAEEVQANYKSFRTFGLASQTLALTCGVTLVAAIFGEEPVPEPGQSDFMAGVGHYKWGILSGVAYLATGMIASSKLEKTIETHNAVISPTLSQNGVGIQLKF